jgi:predicted phosphodiesterase
MRTLIFSDTHLTDHFDQSQCDYIVKLVKSVDQVILNGDFWDGYLCSYEDFARAWQPLLGVLAKTKTIYIPGNHDRYEWLSKQRIHFASLHNDEVTVKIGNLRYRIQHGNTIAPEFDDRHQALTQFFARFYWMIVWLRKHSLLGILMRKYDQRVSQDLEKTLIDYARAQSVQADLFVFGHTHLVANVPESQYLNPGISTPQMMRYLLIDTEGYLFFEASIPQHKVY